MTCLAVATLASIPVSNHIAAFNDRIRAAVPASAFFLHVPEAAHWIQYGFITAEEYEQAMTLELEKELRKAWDDNFGYDDDQEEPEIDPMEGWYI
jgi:hypothetical protein